MVTGVQTCALPIYVELFGMGELVKWLSKPPEPLATQTHETEDEGGASGRRRGAESESGHRTRRIPYLARQLSVFTAKPAQGYP